MIAKLYFYHIRHQHGVRTHPYASAASQKWYTKTKRIRQDFPPPKPYEYKFLSKHKGYEQPHKAQEYEFSQTIYLARKYVYRKTTHAIRNTQHATRDTQFVISFVSKENPQH